MTLAAAAVAALLAGPLGGQGGNAPTATAGEETVRDLLLLADDRPVLLRLRIRMGDRPFEAAWRDAVGAIHGGLDRDGDGTLSPEEADAAALAALVRLATGAAEPPARVDLGGAAEDGSVTVDELAGPLRDVLGPVGVRADRPAIGRTDALFDQLDRDKDGLLTEFELGAVVAALRRLDLDDDEMIAAAELESFRDPTLTVDPLGPMGRAPAAPAGESVVERSPDESTLRLSRTLMRRYDTGRGPIPGPPDSMLSPDEFAIAPDAFDEADGNGDGALRLEELRRHLDRGRPDVTLDVSFPADASDRPSIAWGGDGEPPEGVAVQMLGDGDAQVDIGHVRLDLRLDDGEAAAEAARRAARAQFSAADADEDGSLSPEERSARASVSTTFAGLLDAIDRDGNDAIAAEELDAFVGRQAEAARGRLRISASDQGRAIFAIVDRDRDLRLGAREVMGTVARVSSWDGDYDGRVAAGEVPYHFRVTLARGGLAGLAGDTAATAGSTRPEAGPRWFRLMDRNDDGDVSRREFLGTRGQFDRLDRDADGLIDPAEAEAPGDR